MMSRVQPDYVLRDGFVLWLEEKQRDGFRPAARMDPYGTSLRNTARTVAWLREVRDGRPLTANTDRTRQQAVSDMKALGLVVGNWTMPEITELGLGSLGLWESLGVAEDDDSEAAEITRDIVLLRQAQTVADDETRTYYAAMYQRWGRIVAMRPADYWLDDLTRMMLPSYLDQTDCRGYNPFSAFVGVSGGDIGNTVDWSAWSKAEWSGGQALDALLSYISSNHRPGGSAAFRRAMEALRVTATAPQSLPALLDRWEIPS